MSWDRRKSPSGLPHISSPPPLGPLGLRPMPLALALGLRLMPLDRRKTRLRGGGGGGVGLRPTWGGVGLRPTSGNVGLRPTLTPTEKLKQCDKVATHAKRALLDACAVALKRAIFTKKFAKIRVLKFFQFFFDENLPRVMDYHGIPNSTLYSW